MAFSKWNTYPAAQRCNTAFANNTPAVNIKETEQAFLIDMAAAGLTKEDFKIRIEKDLLTISAEKEHEKTTQSERYTRKEFNFNTFSRSFTLPENIEVAKIEAKYENGLLKVLIPKRTEEKHNDSIEIQIV